MKPTLLYVMDPLCGWCYGYSAVMQQLYQQYKNDFEFKVVPGGMITGDRVQPVSVMASYILQAYKRVEEYSGVKFGEPYLDILRAGTEISDSEPPCRAIHTFQTMQPENIIPFTHALQLQLFEEGHSFNNPDTYRELAKKFGIDPELFITTMNSEEMRYGTMQEFQWVQAAGITGFPCTVIQKNEEYFLAAQGFQSYEGVSEVIKKIVE